MANNWQDVRFRGDALDVEELANAYRVKDYLDTHPHHRKPPATAGGSARGGATLHGYPQGSTIGGRGTAAHQ